MREIDVALLGILQVARDSSIRGVGISLVDALSRCRYQEFRSMFTAEDFVPLLQGDPQLVQDWLLFSEDKRTTGGWYVLETGEVGNLTTGTHLQFPSLPISVANFVTRELDYCAGCAG